MKAFPEARTETAPRDREAPSGSARRRGEETGDRLTRSGVCGRPQKCPHERPPSWSAVSLDYLETNRPEVSRSALPRRPTCRAPYLDSSRTEPLDTMDQVGRNRPAWMRLVPTRGGRRLPRIVPTIRRSGQHCQCKCLYASVDFESASTREANGSTDGAGARKEVCALWAGPRSHDTTCCRTRSPVESSGFLREVAEPPRHGPPGGVISPPRGGHTWLTAGATEGGEPVNRGSISGPWIGAPGAAADAPRTALTSGTALRRPRGVPAVPRDDGPSGCSPISVGAEDQG